MIGAAIDLGSNSFICLIFKMDESGEIKTLHDQVILTRMSEGVDKDHMLSAASLERAEKAFQSFASLFKKYEVQKILGVATSAVRDASNRQDFLDLASRYKIPIQILSGTEEARMTFEGVKDKFKGQSGVIVDIGGGSTEFIYVENAEIQERASLNMGAVRFSERFDTFKDFASSEERLIHGIVKELDENETLKKFKNLKIDLLLAVSGTPTNVASLLLGGFKPEKIENFVLTDSDLLSLNQRYSYLSLSDRLTQYPYVEEKRADVLPVGIAILYQSMKFFDVKSYLVSTQGIRHGAAKSISHI